MDHDLPGDQPARGVIPRRTAIASVGALVAGVGAIGVGAYGKDSKPTADQQYNVRDFGAVGDGLADDTGHLQRALDAFPQERAPQRREVADRVLPRLLEAPDVHVAQQAAGHVGRVGTGHAQAVDQHPHLHGGGLAEVVDLSVHLASPTGS